MTDISIHYYDGGWQDLTNYATGFQTEDSGIQKVGSATINLQAERSNLSAYLSNPYRLIKIRAKPDSTWQNLFFGYVDVPYVKTETGTIAERSVMSLDCLSFESRLAQDYITYDYYALNSALHPSGYGITYRGMLEDIYANPDSKDDDFPYGTGFEIMADVDAYGIDAVLEGVGNWSNQTLFEATRLTCEQIGYDGYYYMPDDLSTTQIKLYPFSKSSIATLANPFIGEPLWSGGSLADIANKIYVEGGVDAGFPSDGDRWTEHAATKYSPAIWLAAREGGSTTTVTDEDNTIFAEGNRFNSKCIKVSTTGSTNRTLNITLDLTHTEPGRIDIENRIAGVTFAMSTFGLQFAGTGYHLNYYLKDDSGNELVYHQALGGSRLATTNFEELFSVTFSEPIQVDTGLSNAWCQYVGSTFNREEIVSFRIQIAFVLGVTIYTGQTFGCYIDGFQFFGGQKISQFNENNPPASDAASISAYGIHPFKHTDSEITSFEQAQAEAARLLNNLHEPIGTLKVTKLYGTDTYGTTWATQLYPSNVVTCQSVDYRVAKVTYDWNKKARGTPVYATYKLVGKTSPLPPIWTQINELRFLVK